MGVLVLEVFLCLIRFSWPNGIGDMHKNGRWVISGKYGEQEQECSYYDEKDGYRVWLWKTTRKD